MITPDCEARLPQHVHRFPGHRNLTPKEFTPAHCLRSPRCQPSAPHSPATPGSNVVSDPDRYSIPGNCDRASFGISVLTKNVDCRSSRRAALVCTERAHCAVRRPGVCYRRIDKQAWISRLAPVAEVGGTITERRRGSPARSGDTWPPEPGERYMEGTHMPHLHDRAHESGPKGCGQSRRQFLGILASLGSSAALSGVPLVAQMTSPEPGSAGRPRSRIGSTCTTISCRLATWPRSTRG